MNLSQTGIDLIKRFELFEPNPYPDPVGIMTVGYGHVIREGESFDHSLTEHGASELLRKDAAEAENAVRIGVKVSLTQDQFDALVSLIFNIGTGAFIESTLLRKLNKGNKIAAGCEFIRWNRAGGKVMDGLTKRRILEAALFLKEL
jgi:lysozyme